MSVSLARYHATPQLRFVEWHIPDPPLTEEQQPRRILQQMWQHEETGSTLWRDVPLSREGGNQS